MKKILLLTPLFLLSLLSFGQAEEASDTTKLRMGNSTVYIVKNSDDLENLDVNFNEEGSCENDTTDDGTTLFVDLGINGYMAPDFQTSLPAELENMELNYSRSHTLASTLMFKEAATKNQRLYVRMGLGFSWNSYALANNVQVGTSNDSTTFTSDSLISFNKLKLNTTHLQVPLIVGLRLGDLENKPMGLHVGVIGGYKIVSRVKQRYEIDDAKYRSRIRDNFNISPFQLEAVARITVGDFGCFAKYSLTPLFQNGKGPEVNAFSVGITFGEF